MDRSKTTFRYIYYTQGAKYYPPTHGNTNLPNGYPCLFKDHNLI